MGPGFLKLLTLATANILLATILCSAVLSHTRKDHVQSLTEANIQAFIREASDLENGKRADTDQYAAAEWLDKHLAETGTFKSTLRYNAPEASDHEKDVAMDKKSFIAAVLQERSSPEKYDAAITIEYVKIAPGARSATAVVTDTERGIMAITDPNSGEASKVPVTGTSYCEQSFILNDRHLIEMTGATCTTDMSVADSY